MLKVKSALVVLALAIAGFSQTAFACSKISVHGAYGSPATVTGSPVRIWFSGFSNDALYVDGVVRAYMPSGDPGEPWAIPITVSLAPGNHTASISSDSCVEQFTVAAVPAGQQLVYRFYWHQQKDHLLTLSYSEGDAFAEYEGIGFRTFTAPIDGDMHELYRCWWGSVTNHFVSPDPNCEGLTYEGSYGYVSSIPRTGFVPLYRFYHSGLKNHLSTTNYSEGAGWSYEGVQGYVPQ